MRACVTCSKQTSNAKFCSRSCSAIHTNSTRPKRKRMITYCLECGRETSDKRRRRCLPCANEMRRLVGDRTIADVHNSAKYQVSARIRTDARIVMKRSCKPKVCMVCGYSIHVEVSHRRSISSFDPTTRLDEVNHIDNLDYLCRNHHWEYENGHLILSQETWV